MMHNEIKTLNQKRIAYIDMLRGLMLVIMTFDHLGGPLKSITFQPVGFVSAAAGFIYLSGFIYGVVYSKRHTEHGFETIRSKSINRAAVIYFYHLTILFIIAILFFGGIDLEGDLRFFKEKPAQSLLLFAFLIYQPTNMDILPMYIIFILFAPYVLRVIMAGKWKKALAISVSLWLINQIPFLQYNRLDDSIERINFGYFNILSWQILFFTGVFFGHAKAIGKALLPVSKATITLALIGSVVYLIIRHMPSEMYIYGLFARFADRSTLGFVRLTNFMLLAYLIYVITLRYPNFFESKWLSFLGRHSIQVYAYSVCIIYFIGHINIVNYHKEFWAGIIMDLILVATLTLPALLHQFMVRKYNIVKKYGL